MTYKPGKYVVELGEYATKNLNGFGQCILLDVDHIRPYEEQTVKDEVEELLKDFPEDNWHKLFANAIIAKVKREIGR